MNDEHLEISEELRQLREDYSTIKKELEREKIVNEELLDSTFKRNVRTIMGDKKLSIIAGLIAAFLLPMIGFLFAAPFKYIAILEIYVLALTSVYILFYKKYDFNMIPSFDVLNASRMMKEFKKSYTHMIFISWSVAIAILVSFCPMIIKAWSTPLKAICAISFLVIVLVVCLFLEYHYSKKIIDSCDSIIKRLDNCNE